MRGGAGGRGGSSTRSTVVLPDERDQEMIDKLPGQMQNLLKYCASPGIPIFTGRPEHSVSFFLQFGNAARAHGIWEMFKPPSERHQVLCEEVRLTDRKSVV